MQLVRPISVLLACLLVSLSGVEARPAKRGADMITLPLKRLQQNRDNVHPQVYLQQHINRGVRRHARMTGRAQPSRRELEERIRGRMHIAVEGRSTESKRYYNPLVNRLNRKGKKHAPAKSGAAGANSSSGAAGANSSSGAAGANSSSGAAGGAGAGISPIDVEAENGGLTPASNPTANDSLGLQIEANDVGYIATVQMGTPPQNFNLLMDSGSADLWVGSETCTSQAGGGCGNHTFLGNQSSSTFVDTGAPFSVTYGTGQVTGTVIQDNLAVAGLALNNHSFGVADSESVDFSADTTLFDGLMGLAKSALSEEGVPTPPESMAAQGLIGQAITSFKLARVTDATNDGEVTFGGLDASKFNANTLVTFDNVNTEGFWEGAMTAVTSNGQDLGLKGRTAILDTGTTLIIAPDADAQAVHATIPGAASDGQGGFTIPCTSNTSIAMTFGGHSFAINPADLLFVPVDPNDLTGTCQSGISSGEIGAATEWLLGDVFLKNAYFSVNVNTNQISLAELV